jgi:hypothetical protein
MKQITGFHAFCQTKKARINGIFVQKAGVRWHKTAASLYDLLRFLLFPLVG